MSIPPEPLSLVKVTLAAATANTALRLNVFDRLSGPGRSILSDFSQKLVSVFRQQLPKSENYYTPVGVLFCRKRLGVLTYVTFERVIYEGRGKLVVKQAGDRWNYVCLSNCWGAERRR